MRPASRLTAAITGTALAAIIGGATACRDAAQPDRAIEMPTAAPAADLANDGASIYALETSLTDQHGRAVTLKDLGGHVVVASMVYASCTSVCPRVTSEMLAIEGALDPTVRTNTRFALFSLDPARDTPEAWRRFGAEHRLDASRWRLLSPTEDGVLELAAVLGVKFAPEANGEIAHTAILVVLDRLGVVVHRQVGLGQDKAPVLAAIARAEG